MASAEIIGTEKAFSQAKDRQGKVDRIVLYRTDSDPARTLWVVVPEETYSPETVQAAIRRNELERRPAAPVKFQL